MSKANTLERCGMCGTGKEPIREGVENLVCPHCDTAHPARPHDCETCKAADLS